MDDKPETNALPLMGKAYWIARAAAPGADRVGPDFTLAPFPRHGESEPLVPAARAEPRSKPRRSRAA